VKEGLIVSIEDAEAREFRAAIIEGLMTNHPHDCPVCDEGGECHLQDMTVMTGHNYRRFDFKKRTYTNQYLGPFINHEINRCIQCYRCVRFYRDYAGGKDLNVFAAHNHVYFGRHEDGVLESEFSGNLIEVCPTGVFTDKTLKKHFTRKWDLSNAPSICVHCSVGCNILVSERYDSLRRIMNRYNGAVNGYFICDRGRFGYEFVNDDRRIRNTKIRPQKEENQVEADNKVLTSRLKTSLAKGQKIIGIGSPRASLESNFALSVLVGNENFYHGISKKEQLLTHTVLNFLQKSGVQTPSLKQIEQADAVLIFSEDLTNTAPMIALAVRQASRNIPNQDALKKGIPIWDDGPSRELAQDTKSPVFIVTPFKDGLDDLAEGTFRASYDDIAYLGFVITASLDNKFPISITADYEHQKFADKIASVLRNAKNPLIISGITNGNEAIVHAALNIAKALFESNPKCMLSMVLPECNSMGLAFIPGKALDDVIALAAVEEIDSLVILENDLYRRASAEMVDFLLERSKQIIVLDHLTNKTAVHADLLLPAATFAESEGTLVNNEGRAQRYYKAIVNSYQVKESWRWIDEIIKIKNQFDILSWNRFDDIVSSLVNKWPVFSKLKTYVPDADFRMLNEKIPRQTMRYSGRTAIHANVAVSEVSIPNDPDSPFAFSMEGQPQRPPSSLVPFYWSPGWNSVQAMYNDLDEPNGSLKGGDPGIRLIEPDGTADISYFKMIPTAKKLQKDEWMIVPAYQIFGSEELSSAGQTLTQRIMEPFVYLNRKDADSLGAVEGNKIRLVISKTNITLIVRIENSLKQGIAGVSFNLPGMPFIELPGIGMIYKL
jgi:NADH-quinone oxidoreductase subunit G